MDYRSTMRTYFCCLCEIELGTNRCQLLRFDAVVQVRVVVYHPQSSWNLVVMSASWQALRQVQAPLGHFSSCDMYRGPDIRTMLC